MKSFWAPFDYLGRNFNIVAEYAVTVFTLVYLSFRAVLVQRGLSWGKIAQMTAAHVYNTGWLALPLISVLAFASGTVVIVQTFSNLSKFGGVGMLGQILVAIIFRELGPLMTALVVIARSGPAVASELGNMKVSRETEALETMGINPLAYVVFPRLLGGMISVVCLAFHFIFIAFIGGYAVVHFSHDVALRFYIDTLAQAITSTDALLFLLKNLFSGTMIFIISCHHGLLVRESLHEVPLVTTKATVNSIIFVVCFNMLATLTSYVSGIVSLGVL